jgi:hypothetical protein
MIIDRFGDTYSTAYVFPRQNVIDDWGVTRPPVSARVGGMAGAFDFYGSDNYPIGPMVIRKSFSMLGKRTTAIAGTGTLATGVNAGEYVGTATAFLTEVYPGDVIAVSTYTLTVMTVSDNTNFTASSGVAVDPFTGLTFTITQVKITGARVDDAVNELKAATITQGEHKLWALDRDASTKRWCYAKCTDVKAAEQVNAVYVLPVSVEFFAREGFWYSESTTTTSLTQANNATPVSMPTVGTIDSDIVLNVTSSTGTMTGYTLTNNTNGDTVTWAGSAAVGVLVALNTAAYTIKNGGVGAYSGLTIGTNQVKWFRLSPGANSVTLTVTGSTAWAATLVRHDQYL